MTETQTKSTQLLRFACISITLSMCRAELSHFPIPNTCTPDTKQVFFPQFAWSSDDCPRRALCVPDSSPPFKHNTTGHCSCLFSEQMFLQHTHNTENGPQTSCRKSKWTNLYASVWLLVSLVAYFVGGWSVQTVVVAARAKQLHADTLGVTAVLVVVAAFCMGTLRMLVAIDLFVLPSGKAYERIVTAVAVISVLTAFVFGLLVLTFGATILVALLTTAKLGGRSETLRQTRRVNTVVVFFSVLSLLSVVPMWYREYAIASLCISVLGLATWVLYKILSNNIVRQLTAHNSFEASHTVLDGFRQLSNKVIWMCVGFLISSIAYNIFWFVGRYHINRTLLGPLSAVVVVTYFAVLVGTLFLFASTIRERLYQRVMVATWSPASIARHRSLRRPLSVSHVSARVDAPPDPDRAQLELAVRTHSVANLPTPALATFASTLGTTMRRASAPTLATPVSFILQDTPRRIVASAPELPAVRATVLPNATNHTTTLTESHATTEELSSQRRAVARQKAENQQQKQQQQQTQQTPQSPQHQQQQRQHTQETQQAQQQQQQQQTQQTQQQQQQQHQTEVESCATDEQLQKQPLTQLKHLAVRSAHSPKREQQALSARHATDPGSPVHSFQRLKTD